MLSQWNPAIERNHEVFIFPTLSFQEPWLPIRTEPFQANSVDRIDIKLCWTLVSSLLVFIEEAEPNRDSHP